MHEIPKGWEVKKLRDIAITSSGGTPLRTHSEYWNGNIKWLKISDLNDSLIDNSDEFITEIGLKNSSAKILKKGTLLVAMYGSIGKLGILNTEATTNQAICAIINKKDKKFEIKFLFYFFMSAKEKMLNESFGGVQKNISQTYLKNLEIPLPNLTEQKAIADKLDDSFAKIENAITNLINAKENLKLYKQSVLKSAFNGDLLPNTSPTHWEVKKLEEIFNVIGGGTPNTNNAEFWGGNISWISSADIDKENFNAIPRKFITENAIQNSATNLVPKNTIIVVTRVGLGKVAITKEPMCFSQDSQALIPFEKINVKFMAYQIKQIAQNFINISRGTTINGITKQNLKDCKICVPPLSEQNLIVAEIDRRFAIVDKTLNLIDKSIQNAKNLKQSILKKAFSGELRSEI